MFQTKKQIDDQRLNSTCDHGESAPSCQLSCVQGSIRARRHEPQPFNASLVDCCMPSSIFLESPAVWGAWLVTLGALIAEARQQPRQHGQEGGQPGAPGGGAEQRAGEEAGGGPQAGGVSKAAPRPSPGWLGLALGPTWVLGGPGWAWVGEDEVAPSWAEAGGRLSCRLLPARRAQPTRWCRAAPMRSPWQPPSRPPAPCTAGRSRTTRPARAQLWVSGWRALGGTCLCRAASSTVSVNVPSVPLPSRRRSPPGRPLPLARCGSQSRWGSLRPGPWAAARSGGLAGQPISFSQPISFMSCY